MAVLMTGRAERTPTLFDLLEEPAAAPRDRQVEPAGAPDRQQEPAGPPARSPDRRDGTAQRDSVDGVIAVVRVEHQSCLRANGLANGTNERDVFLEPETNLELHRAKAFAHIPCHFLRDVRQRIARIAAVGAGRVGCNGRAQRAAHELMNWGPEPFALDVPERNVHAAECGHHEPFLPLVAEVIVEELPDLFSRQSIAP